MKTFFTIAIGVILFILLWKFGFLDFMGLEGMECMDGGVSGKYKYGKCSTAISSVSDSNNTTDNTTQPDSCSKQLSDAKSDFAKSGNACIQVAIEMQCPIDKSFKVTTDPCVGKILEGKGWTYVTQPVNPNPPPPTSNQVVVTNPSGAYMYYQSAGRFGGYLYSKSNILIPVGTKITLIKVWQTSDNQSPFSGYYETNYKKYGSNSGFFFTGDMTRN